MSARSNRSQRRNLLREKAAQSGGEDSYEGSQMSQNRLQRERKNLGIMPETIPEEVEEKSAEQHEESKDALEGSCVDISSGSNADHLDKEEVLEALSREESPDLSGVDVDSKEHVSPAQSSDEP